ncbi:MAG: ectoine/hydroxyectoine ABC transporter permease subunit EhuD [Nocardioidaceae bacterium]
MKWDWAYTWQVLPDLLQAFFKYTVGLTVVSAAIAIVLGLVLALGRRARERWLSWPSYGVVEFIRSTPIPIQLFLIYYGLTGFGIRLEAFTSAVIVFGVHYACYTSEVYRAGIEAIPAGQWEACKALSLPPWRTWRAVVLPQVVRRIVPSTGNQVIALFKETPFAIVIGVTEMVTTAKAIGGQHYSYVEPMTIAGLIFLAASYPTSVLMRRLEIRLGH